MAAAIAAFIFKETLSSIIGGIAEKVLNPSLLKDGAMMFTLVEILILIALSISAIALFWPLISKALLTDLDRNTLKSDETGRHTVVGHNFVSEDEIRYFSENRRVVFIDCTFSVDNLFFFDPTFIDMYSISTWEFVTVNDSELSEASKKVAPIHLGFFMNCRFDARSVLVHESSLQQIIIDCSNPRITTYDAWKSKVQKELESRTIWSKIKTRLPHLTAY